MILLWLVDLCASVALNEDKNRMSASNLAKVFAPSVYFLPEHKVPLLTQMQHCDQIVTPFLEDAIKLALTHKKNESVVKLTLCAQEPEGLASASGLLKGKPNDTTDHATELPKNDESHDIQELQSNARNSSHEIVGTELASNATRYSQILDSILPETGVNCNELSENQSDDKKVGSSDMMSFMEMAEWMKKATDEEIKSTLKSP